jgi:DNA-binding transcriptional MerR regulator
MRIGELAALSSVSTRALRYYEKLGLVAPAARTASGYRIYGDDAVQRVAFIKAAQAIGFTLEEIAEVIEIRDSGQAPCSRTLEIIRRRLEEIDRKISDLEELRDALADRAVLGETIDPTCCTSGVCDIVELSVS